MRSKADLKPLCITYRTICGFVCLFSLLGLFLSTGYLWLEGFHWLAVLIGVLVSVSLHVSATIVMTAYAPIYFRFVHLPKESDDLAL